MHGGRTLGGVSSGRGRGRGRGGPSRASHNNNNSPGGNNRSIPPSAKRPKRLQATSSPGDDVVLLFKTCGRDNDEKAMMMLKRVASLVKPLMKKHNFRLPLLTEMFPDNPNLLGLNVGGGREIRLRLRYASDESRFLDEESVVGTMLHELTHNRRSPHDAQFYKILDEFTAEYEAAVANGWRGEGFLAPGKRVGEGVSHNLPDHIARAKAADLLEKRGKLMAIMGPIGGQRLGGNTVQPSKSKQPRLTPGEMAVRAAERRLKDSVWCGARELLEGEVQEEHDCGGERETNETEEGDTPQASTESFPWVCDECTLINESDADSCEVCTASRPADIRRISASASNSPPPRTSITTPPAPRQTSPDTWTCAQCTLINSCSVTACDVCGEAKAMNR